MRIAAWLIILATHAIAIYIAGKPVQVRYRPENSLAITARIIDSSETQTHRIILVPTISTVAVRLDVPPIAKIDAPHETVASHFEPASIDNTRPIKPFSAEGDDFKARPSLTIILLIEVRADGSVGDVEVKASSGDPQTDAAAVAYVGKLRWKPALREGNATPMRIIYSVTT